MAVAGPRRKQNVSKPLKGWKVVSPSLHFAQVELKELLPVLLEFASLFLPADGMVGKNPLRIPASTCEMSQLHAPSLPADFSLYGKQSRKRKRDSSAKGATDRLASGKENRPA